MPKLRCAVVVLVLLAGGCSGGDDEAPLRVLAASSLSEAFTDIAVAFEAAEGIAVELSFGGSQTLVTQLAEGVEADVLATADEQSMDAAAERGLVRDAAIFASNRIVLIVPAANEAGIEEPNDVERPGIRVVLAAEEVPIGRYARATFAELGIDATANVVSEEEDVKGVVGKVVSGEADAGVVYATDAVHGVRSIPLAADVAARYPAAVTDASERRDEATAFVKFLLSSEGAAILSAAGFDGP